MTDIEKITLKIQDILVDIESLRREVKKQEPQKVEKVTIDVDSIVDQAVSECKKILSPVKAQQTKAKKDNKDAFEKLLRSIDNTLKAQEAKLKNQNAIIEDELKKHSSKTDNIKNDLGKKINILSNNLKESIDKAIHEKVTVNFVNNLYRNK